MPLHVVEHTDRFVHLAISGRLDVTEVQVMEVRFLGFTAASGKPAIVDLSGVTFIGSIGLGMLAGAAKALHRHGARMIILSPNEFVELVLLAANLQTVMPIARTLEDARNALGLE